MIQTWDELEHACLGCRRCALNAARHHVVLGTGSRDAQVFFVGEGPGEQEDLQGEPFVGPAGKLLDDMLSIIDIDRSNCYIANIVKCRPPGNRDPKEEEQEACIDYLRAQMFLVQPQVVVCLGRIAAMKLIDPAFRITREHGHWTRKDGIWMTAMYHPSYLLRDPSRRPQAFDDLLSLRTKLRELDIFPLQESGRRE